MKKDHGVWWNIAGGGWVSQLPDHHNQIEMFDGCPINSIHHIPKWGSKPLTFTKEEAEVLAADWSKRKWGSYIALPLGSVMPKGQLKFN